MEKVGGVGEFIFGDLDLIDANPGRMRDPLAGEGLEFFDRTGGGKGEEGTDEVEAFVVRESLGGFLADFFTVEVLI